VDKETRREERNLEKEAKQRGEISGDRRGAKSKKYEPSIYEQAYPGIDFQAQDEKIAVIFAVLRSQLMSIQSTRCWIVNMIIRLKSGKQNTLLLTLLKTGS